MSALFENGTLTGRDHPDTSFDAASVALGKSGTARRRVLEALCDSDDGLTDEEMQFQLGMSANTQRPRRVELVDQLYVRPSPDRRPSLTGTRSIVWVATEEGRQALAAKKLAEEEPR